MHYGFAFVAVGVTVSDGVARLVAGGRVGLAVGVVVGVARGEGAWTVGVASGERGAGPVALRVANGEGTFAVAVGVNATAVAVAAGTCANN